MGAGNGHRRATVSARVRFVTLCVSLCHFGIACRSQGSSPPQLVPANAPPTAAWTRAQRTPAQYHALQKAWPQADIYAKWRDALEHYTPSVTSRSHREVRSLLGVSTYVSHIHNKLHPVFADGFLGSLIPPGLAPREDPVNATAELVLDARDGAVIQMGIVARSGSDKFDAGVLESIQRTGAFGSAPPWLVSADGRVYIRWRFFRDEFYACTTFYVQTYRLVARKSRAHDGPGIESADGERPNR